MVYSKNFSERAHNRALQDAGRKVPPVRVIPESVEHLLLLSAADHMKAVGGDYTFLTFPARSDGQLQLETRTIESHVFSEHPTFLRDMVELEAIADASGPAERVAGLSAALSEVAVAHAQHEQQARDDLRDGTSPGRVCVRVMKSNVGRVKSISTYVPMGGPVLQQGDVAATLHAEMPGSTPERLITNMRPRAVAGSGMHVLLIKDFLPGCSLQELQSQVMGWKRDAADDPERPDVHFALAIPESVVDPDTLSDSLRQLLAARAVPNRDASINVDTSIQPWVSLLDAGFVAPIGSDSSAAPGAWQKVQLTPLALRCMSTSYALHTPTPIFKPRSHLPIDQCTSFECAMLLRDQGWQWQLFPKPIEERKRLVHPIANGPGVFYTLGKTLIHSYLVCLLSADRLREQYGFEAINHYAEKPKYFDGLLQGHPITYKDPAPKRRLQILDADDADDADVYPLAIQFQPRLLQVEMDEDQEIPELGEEGQDALRYLEEMLKLEEDQLQNQIGFAEPDEPQADVGGDASGGGGDVDVGGDGIATPTGGGDDVGGGGDGIATPAGGGDDVGPGGDGVATPTGNVDSDEPVRLTAREPARRPRRKLRIIPWGPMEIARSYSDGKETQSEARCRLHRLNASSNCKKTLKYTADTEDHCLAAMKWWLNEGVHHTRQRTHIRLFEELWEVPYLPEDVLLAQQITQVPEATKTDIQLDQEAKAAANAAAKARATAAKAKAKAKRGRGSGGEHAGRGRGRGRSSHICRHLGPLGS